MPRISAADTATRWRHLERAHLLSGPASSIGVR